MVTILNNSFETWTHGTSFPDPADGTQLADNWFYHKGSAVPSVNITRQVAHVFQGSFSMGLEFSTGGSGSNTTTYVYQNLSNFSSLLGQPVLISGAFLTQNDSTGVSGVLFINDGINPPTFSTTNPIDGNFHILYAIQTIAPNATQLQIGFMPINYGLHVLYVDWINFGTILNLPEFSFLGDTVSHSPLLAPFNEEVRLNEWVNLSVTGSTPWTNSDNNNQFPPES